MRGRKPKQESRALEFYGRLAAWKQTPQSSRPSLRALARQLGTSHQLLSHYLQRWEKWQEKECRRRAKEIRARAEAENRSLTPWEVQQAEAYDKDARYFMLDSALTDALRKCELEITQDVRAGRPPAPLARKFLQVAASKGNQQAREILEGYFKGNAKGHPGNLPPSRRRAAKSFGCVEGVAGNSSKTLPRVRTEIIGKDPAK